MKINPDTLEATVEGTDIVIVQTDCGRADLDLTVYQDAKRDYHLVRDGVARHPDCSAEDIMRAMAVYLQASLYKNVKAATERGGHLLDRVSLTGVDNDTPIAVLEEIASAYRFVEWALLYVPHNEGAPRNPSRWWRQSFFNAVLPGSTAVHLCGRNAFEQLVKNRLPSEIHGCDRLQLNINARKREFSDEQVMEVFRCALDFGPEIILQYHAGTAALILEFLDSLSASDRKRVHILLDESKGTGALLETFQLPEALQGSYCGFAGGLGPDNITAVLAAIKTNESRFWVDMESGIRTDNRFDRMKAERVLEACDRFRG